MSTWKRFYYAWGGFVGLLAIVVLIVSVLPSAIPYVAAPLLPLLIVCAVYGSLVVRCPKCGVRLSETVLAHGLPGEHCPLCFYELKTEEKPRGAG